MTSPLPSLVSSIAVVAVLLAGCSEKPDPARAAMKPPAVPVTLATAAQKDLPVTVTAIGNVQPLSTVGVLSQVNGQIFKVNFREGQEVKQGELLFTLDRRPFEAALQQAQANVARDRAQLAQSEAAHLQQQAQVQQAEANHVRDQAQLENARVWAARYRELVDKEFVAKEQYDQYRTNAEALAATVRADEAAIANARAAARAAEATIESARAAIRADEAAVENARLQLAYTEIRAPLSGRTGNVLIHEGNVVKANDTGNPMVTLNGIHPIYVAFSVPEQSLEDVKRYRAEGTLKVEAVVPGQVEGQARGDLTFVNNTVDPNTGTIQLKATFPNADNLLWPGQFVNVVLTLTMQRNAVVVPSQAIQTGQKGTYVFVVKPDQTVESRPVTPGRTVGRETVVDKGVGPGERVVTDGQLRLYPGAKVDVKQPAAS
jgi:membrane fusion protein, multidrug efflux system